MATRSGNIDVLTSAIIDRILLKLWSMQLKILRTDVCMCVWIRVRVRAKNRVCRWCHLVHVTKLQTVVSWWLVQSLLHQTYKGTSCARVCIWDQLTHDFVTQKSRKRMTHGKPMTSWVCNEISQSWVSQSHTSVCVKLTFLMELVMHRCRFCELTRLQTW